MDPALDYNRPSALAAATYIYLLTTGHLASFPLYNNILIYI